MQDYEELIREDREGYEQLPQEPDEYEIWQAEQVWSDDFPVLREVE